jgi:hypothetical protein
MSLFGKLLAILNVFALLGALTLMTMAYAQRRAWQYKVFQQELWMKGLPLDDKETDEQESPIVERIGEGTKKELFKKAALSSQPVATQVAEVSRVKNELSGQIQAQGDKKKKIYLLARVLTPMAVTSEERLRLMSYQLNLRDDNAYTALVKRLTDADMAAQKAVKDGKTKVYDEAFHEALAAQFGDPPGPLGEAFLEARKKDAASGADKLVDQSLDPALAQLDSQFNQMFADAERGESQKTSLPQRKRTIARLLFNMVDVLPPAGGAEAKPDLVNNPAYYRFLIVVGLKAAEQAVNDQAGFLKEMAYGVEEERLRERGMFAQQHQSAVTLVRERKALVDLHKALYALEKSEYEAHGATVEKRKRDVDFYQAELADQRRKTAEKLEQLRKLSDTLFHERVTLQKNTDENQELEKQIRALEEGR